VLPGFAEPGGSVTAPPGFIEPPQGGMSRTMPIRSSAPAGPMFGPPSSMSGSSISPGGSASRIGPAPGMLENLARMPGRTVAPVMNALGEMRDSVMASPDEITRRLEEAYPGLSGLLNEHGIHGAPLPPPVFGFQGPAKLVDHGRKLLGSGSSPAGLLGPAPTQSVLTAAPTQNMLPAGPTFAGLLGSGSARQMPELAHSSALALAQRQQAEQTIAAAMRRLADPKLNLPAKQALLRGIQETLQSIPGAVRNSSRTLSDELRRVLSSVSGGADRASVIQQAIRNGGR
jgi:hypothetical protein